MTLTVSFGQQEKLDRRAPQYPAISKGADAPPKPSPLDKLAPELRVLSGQLSTSNFNFKKHR